MCVFAACGEYQKLLKSNDPELKYTKAIEYYNKKDYMRAQSLLDEVAHYYKGTERAEDVLNYLSKCYTLWVRYVLTHAICLRASGDLYHIARRSLISHCEAIYRQKLRFNPITTPHRAIGGDFLCPLQMRFLFVKIKKR